MNHQQEPADPLHTLDDVAEHFLQRIRSGQKPSVQEYLDRFPQWADEIRELFPTLAELEHWQPDSDSAAPITQASIVDAPQKLGDYEIQREIGRGGMGVVYEAWHTTMRRRVALKLMPLMPAQPNRIQRFLREARAAGLLHHTNIVPVFEVGQTETHCYYSMQYIDGHNLDVVIDELSRMVTAGNPSASPGSLTSTLDCPSSPQSIEPQSTVLADTTTLSRLSSSSSSGSSEWSRVGRNSDCYFRRVARVGIQIAEALHFAHSQGILHRDIKPANLILDTSGKVWIADFGLATDNADSLTHSGDIVGTLRYMAPERFHQDADVRSEVYSLGLTLYELCTLKPAFGQNDRARLVQEIQNHHPVSPRRIRPDLPVDLETVIAKAISREPAQRYASAQLLADDLNRFLSDLPVLARRVSQWERIYRWARRNPMAAGLISCLFLMAALVSGGSLYLADVQRQHAEALASENRKMIHEKTRTEAALNLAESARSQSQENLFQASLEKGQALLGSGRPGQRFQCLQSLRVAWNLLPELKLTSQQKNHRQFLLRSAAASAASQWDLQTVHQWQTTGERISSVAFDFANQRTALGDDDGNIQIRGFDHPAVDITLPTPGQRAWMILFSPDGRYLLARYHHPVHRSDPFALLWNVQEARIVHRTEQVSLNAWHAFSPDSSMCAVAGKDQTIEVRATESGHRLLQITAKHPVERIFFSTRKKQLILLDNQVKQLQFFPLETKVRQWDSVALEAAATAIAWDDTSETLAVAYDNNEIVVSRLHDESSAVRLTGHQSRVVRMWLHPSLPILASFSWDGTTRMYDLDRRKEVLRVEGMQLVFSGFDATSGQIGFTGETHQFGVWKLPEQLACRRIDHLYGQVVGELVRGNGCFVPGHPEWLVYGSPNRLQIWDHVQNRIVTETSVNHLRRIRPGSDNNLWIADDSGVCQWTIQLHDDAGVTLIPGPPVSKRKVKDFAISQDQQRLALLDNDRVWIGSIGPNTLSPVGRHALASRIEFLSHDRIATSTWQGQGIHVWDSHAKIAELTDRATNASVDVHPVTKQIWVITGTEQWAIDPQTLKRVWTEPRPVPDGWAGDLSFSPDGRLVALPGSRYVPQLANADSGAPWTTLETSARDSTNDFHWSSDGRFVSVSDGQQLQVWDVQYLSEMFQQLPANQQAEPTAGD